MKKILTVLLSVLLCVSLTLPTVNAAGSDWLSIISDIFSPGGGDADYLRSMFKIINLLSTEEEEELYTPRDADTQLDAATLDEYQEYVQKFNDSVNQIKTVHPSYNVTTMAGIPIDGSADIKGTFSLVSGSLSAISSLLLGTDNTINVDNLISTFGIDTLFNDARESKVYRGDESNSNISVRGMDYVSNLTANDFYDIDFTSSRYGGYVMKGYLKDCINPDGYSAQARVFDLMDDTKFYQSIASLAPGVSLDLIQIKYVECYVEAKVNKLNKLTQYTTHYKCVVHIDEEKASVSGYNLGDLMGIGEFAIYESEIIYNDFNWNERHMGDVNDDDRITASDARTTLRVAAGLEKIEPFSPNFKYADVDGNGKITAKDARTILRAAAGLERL